MIAMVITASVVLAGLIALVATLTLWLRWAYIENGTLRGDMMTEMRRGDDLVDQRDEQKVRADSLEVERTELQRRLKTAEEQRNRLVEEEVKHVVQRVRESSDPADAIRQLDELLQAPLPSAAAIDSASTRDDRG